MSYFGEICVVKYQEQQHVSERNLQQILSVAEVVTMPAIAISKLHMHD